MASCALSILLCMQDTDHRGTMRNLHVGQIHMAGGCMFIYFCYIDLHRFIGCVYELRSKNDILIIPYNDHNMLFPLQRDNNKNGANPNKRC